MSFLFPIFLVAGLTVAIPVAIHLFNLRRYKTVYFPHSRFLRTVQLHSRKQSQVKYKWLLACRIAFLFSLVLAFAQPFFSHSHQTNNKRLQVVYIDNSASMTIPKGTRTLLDIALETARKQIAKTPNAQFVILSNDNMSSNQPSSSEKAFAELSNISPSSLRLSSEQVISRVQQLLQNEPTEGADLYFYSDFQKNSFPSTTGIANASIHFFGVPIQNTDVANFSIDTAFLAQPRLQTNLPNQIVVICRKMGKGKSEMPVLQLNINNQPRSATTPHFDADGMSRDTLSFQVNTTGWQQLLLTLNDATIRYDDTFRIAARSAAHLSVLVLNEHQVNPFILAGLKAYSGFQADQHNLDDAVDWKPYNLVVLNGLSGFTDGLTQKIISSLQQGQSICIFPSKASDLTSLNKGLQTFAGIHIDMLDTSIQKATGLQQGSDLVRDLFDRIPPEVQLPQANWHYKISAGLTANQQSIISFRNGDPLLAQYTPNKGKLYFFSSGIDEASGNFSSSYFFVPFLYKMASLATSGDVFALRADQQQPIFISMQQKDERNMVHLLGNGIDIIPPQRPSGAGLQVFVGQVLHRSGFYSLTSKSNDTILIALNQNNAESQLSFWSFSELQSQWKDANIHWLANQNTSFQVNAGASFPLWKVCIILALLMLAAETFVLTSSSRTSSIKKVAT
ncbi:MAG: BatA domain-containing protein [Bacteroidetes bacterium]|nr:BatA domain-containing protein [Bacteroidota bacterium]